MGELPPILPLPFSSLSNPFSFTATLSFIAGYAEPSTPEDDFDDFGVQYDEDEGIHDQKQGVLSFT